MRIGQLEAELWGRGRFRFCTRDAEGNRLWAGPWSRNTFLYGWATIVVKLLSGDQTYRLSAMYIEYENVAAPGDAVSTPTISRDEGKSYYDGLSTDPARDYLRVPLRFTAIESSDDELFPGGNILRVSATTSGTSGVHGKDFSSAANSKIYGAALVATPDFADDSQDVVFNRSYKETDEQLVKTSGLQLDVEAEVPLS